MGHHNLPSPPQEDAVHKPARKSSSKSSRSSGRTTKRAGSHGLISAATSHLEAHSPSASDGRHKRVWKACERCRMKKTKCDGEFPCKRCKDDGLICTAGVRKKVEYKQLPRGYAEVLESTQFALIATIHKLYSMVRNGESWEFGDPELNDRGLPVVHNIASKLGCIRPNSDIDLPVHSVFPEDERDLGELVRQLETQQNERQAQPSISTRGGSVTPTSNRTDISSASEHEHSDLEDDHRPTPSTSGQVFLSPQSLPPYNDFDVPPEQSGAAGVLFPDGPTMADFAAAWDSSTSMSMLPDFLAQSATLSNAQMLTQGLLESEFGRLRPHIVSCPNPEVMLGVGDPIMYSGFDDDDGQQMRM